ncbi:hypothetical protein [Thalassoglobus neptunius]|uniref:hypothetical protein n=1 Tax=Thalassoglobus neptunius TaxID=1938619 RepID=UPI0011B80862|nr:hypothetical protein [Thalassoglobus neptunius]
MLDRILKNYRQQFLEILSGDDLAQARLAAELLVEEDVERFVSEEKTGGRSFADLRPGIAPILEKMRAGEDWPTPEELGHLSYSLCSDATKPEKWRASSDERTRQRDYTSVAAR